MCIICLVIVGFFVVAFPPKCEQCPPVEPLLNALHSARNRMVDGRIMLNMVDPRPAHSTLDRQLMCPGSTSLATIYRVPAGQTAFFNCTLPECEDREVCAYSEQLFWAHMNHSIWHVVRHQTTSPFSYTEVRNATPAQVQIHNVTAAAAGQVHCIWERSTADTCIVNVYELLPMLTSADVFATTHQNVSATVGNTVTLRCDLRPFSVYGTPRSERRYMWWYEKQVIMAPSFHPVAGLVRSLVSYSFEHNDAYTSLTITGVQKSHAGRYRCWSKAFYQVDEWFEQEIILHV